VLLVLEMLWGRATLVMFAVSFDGMPDFKGSLLALLDPDNIGFIVAWAAVGAVFAGLIYSISVVAMPMILHRQTDAITAGLTSLRLVLGQTGVMLWWALLIALLVGAGAAAVVPGPAGHRPGGRPCLLACLPRAVKRLMPTQGISTVEPVVLRASRSRCAWATSARS
jgi:hypothetical protein